MEILLSILLGLLVVIGIIVVVAVALIAYVLVKAIHYEMKKKYEERNRPPR